MKLQLHTIAKIITAIFLFSAFKFYDIYLSNQAGIKSKEQELFIANVDKTKAEKNLILANSLTHEGKGDFVNISTPTLVNVLNKDMIFFGITGKITAEIDGLNVKISDLPSASGKSKYTRLNIKGNFRSYESFKSFVSRLRQSGLSINKISVIEKMTFEIGFDLIGK